MGDVFNVCLSEDEIIVMLALTPVVRMAFTSLGCAIDIELNR